MRRSFQSARTAGERKLPGGLAVLLLAIALVSCGGASAVPASGSPSPATATTAPSSSGGRVYPPVPTLGGPAATGVILPTYFVTILESHYGLLTVVTTPGSSCTLAAVMPDGSERTDPEIRTPRITDGGGRASFTYPASSAAPGLGIHTVSCSLAGQREQARARFEVK